METSMEYRIAKLKRDFPEIVERILSGEFKTIAAAELAAGIDKQSPTSTEKVLGQAAGWDLHKIQVVEVLKS